MHTLHAVILRCRWWKDQQGYIYRRNSPKKTPQQIIIIITMPLPIYTLTKYSLDARYGLLPCPMVYLCSGSMEEIIKSLVLINKPELELDLSSNPQSPSKLTTEPQTGNQILSPIENSIFQSYGVSIIKLMSRCSKEVGYCLALKLWKPITGTRLSIYQYNINIGDESVNFLRNFE